MIGIAVVVPLVAYVIGSLAAARSEPAPPGLAGRQALGTSTSTPSGGEPTMSRG